MSVEGQALLTTLDQYQAQPRELFDVLPPLNAIIAALRAYVAVQEGNTSNAGGGTSGGGTPVVLPPTPSFDAASLSVVNAAIAAAAPGSKRTAGWAAWSARLGGSWHIVLQKDGVTKYDVKYTAAFTAATILTFPATPNTTVTNIATAFSSGTWAFLMHKDGDVNTRLLATAGGTGSGKQVILSADLDGSNTIDFSGLNFYFNAALDTVIGALPTTLSATDPRIIRWIKPDKPWDSSIAYTIYDGRMQADHQYTLSDQLITPGVTYGGITTVRTNDRISWNGIDLMRRYASEPAPGTFSGATTGPGGLFLMQLNPNVPWDASQGTWRAIMSTFGNEIAYNDDIWWGLSIEPLPSMITTGVFMNLFNAHYGDQSPKTNGQQPFEVRIGDNGALTLLITWASDSTPQGGGQQEIWNAPSSNFSMSAGHRYYFGIRFRIHNSTGRLEIWIRDGLAGTKTKWVDYSGPMGWPGSSGTFGPKWGPYALGAVSWGLLSDGSLCVRNTSPTGLPALNEDIMMDTVAYA